MNTELSDYLLMRIQSANGGIKIDKKRVKLFLIQIKKILFPEIDNDICDHFQTPKNGHKIINLKIHELENNLLYILNGLGQNIDSEKILQDFIFELKEISEFLFEDAKAILEGDPAAQSLEEVLTCYPGISAIATYRCAHYFYTQNIKLLPRLLSEMAHTQTGIDIHPGAKIGKRFYIDHGTGVVIGETAVIGNNVKIYQGVTIGSLSVSKELQDKKRHPTIHDNCVIYSNATILGGHTVIGKNSIVGGNVWLTKSIPENSRIYHKAHSYFETINTSTSEEIFYEI